MSVIKNVDIVMLDAQSGYLSGLSSKRPGTNLWFYENKEFPYYVRLGCQHKYWCKTFDIAIEKIKSITPNILKAQPKLITTFINKKNKTLIQFFSAILPNQTKITLLVDAISYKTKPYFTDKTFIQIYNYPIIFEENKYYMKQYVVYSDPDQV